MSRWRSARRVQGRRLIRLCFWIRRGRRLRGEGMGEGEETGKVEQKGDREKAGWKF